MPSPEWEYHARCGRQTMVLLPGWATDARIFAGLAGDSNVVTPQGLLTGAAEGLADVLVEIGAGPVLLLGWSLGGYAAADFARRYPELVERVVLASIRPHYPDEQIAAMRQALEQERASCLTTFYRQCFLPAQRAHYRQFRATLESAYLAEWNTAELLAGLDYLAEAELTPATLPACPTTLVHGAQDVIAPFAEALRLGEEAGMTVQVVADAAHAVFLAEEFLPKGW